MPKGKSNSNVLKCIIRCLEEETCPHVLFWKNRANMIFTVLFVHKKCPKWNESYLDLFRELDRLSPKKDYFSRPNYEKDCKVRCKSNLKKLCNEGTLVAKGEKQNFGKSIFSQSYQIKDPSGTYRRLMTGKTVKNDVYCYGESPEQEKKMASEQSPKAEKLVAIDFLRPFHYPCLSDQIWSLNQNSGNSSSMDNKEDECVTLIIYLEDYNGYYEESKNLSESGSKQVATMTMDTGFSIHGSDYNGYHEESKNLSESGSKQVATMTMNTGFSIHGSYTDKALTPVGLYAEESFYQDALNCNEEKVNLSNQSFTENMAVGNEETEMAFEENSYNFSLTQDQNEEYFEPERVFMNIDKDDYAGFNNNLDNIQPSIGLMEEASDPFMGYINQTYSTDENDVPKSVKDDVIFE